MINRFKEDYELEFSDIDIEIKHKKGRLGQLSDEDLEQ